MKCICPNCKLKLFVKRNDLQGLKNPILTCPSCAAKVLIKPSQGRCGACSEIFKYYDFMFPLENAIVPCPNCNKKNKLLINY